jgi:hypothetical protein
MPPDVITFKPEEALHDDALDGFCPRDLGTTNEGPGLMAGARMQACLVFEYASKSTKSWR